MKNTVKQIVLTPADVTHGGLGLSAVINGLWLDYLNPVVAIYFIIIQVI